MEVDSGLAGVAPDPASCLVLVHVVNFNTSTRVGCNVLNISFARLAPMSNNTLPAGERQIGLHFQRVRKLVLTLCCLALSVLQT